MGSSAGTLRLFQSRHEIRGGAEDGDGGIPAAKLPDLVGACNRLIVLCSQALQEKTGKEWILVVEDLDKAVISPQEHLKP